MPNPRRGISFIGLYKDPTSDYKLVKQSLKIVSSLNHIYGQLMAS